MLIQITKFCLGTYQLEFRMTDIKMTFMDMCYSQLPWKDIPVLLSIFIYDLTFCVDKKFWSANKNSKIFRWKTIN